MSATELYTVVKATKTFLNKEVIRHRLNDETVLSLQEIQTRLDMIHEAERIGLRNLDERRERKLSKMIVDLIEVRHVDLN